MSKSLATKNVAAILVAVALVFGFTFAFAAPAKADTLSDLQAQVQALLAQIAAMQGSSSTMTGGSCTTFTQNLTVGSTGAQVMAAQQFLNTHGAQVSATGAGSPGNETSTFGPKTKAAVIVFQTANGISPTSGYWGPLTRAKANSMCAGSTGTTGTTGGTVTPTGPGITVSAAAQPANSLAPQGASRVPFTSFTLTNNTGATVTINGVSVQRTGLALDQAFASVVLVDNNGLQVGVSRTFDSNHQAVVGDTFTLNPGQSVTYTVAGNMATNEGTNAGQVASISVIGVNTSVPVSGSLPISGAQQTINASLTTGSVTVNISSFDPNSALTKHIGDTAVKFTGVRLSAGSQEDLKLYSIRFRLNGTISPGDVGNLVVVIGGTSYPTTWSADGRYVTASIPGGVLIAKGNSADVYLQGDITGTGAAGRIVEFDVDKTSDIYLVGQTYGYGILPVAPTNVSLNANSTHGTLITSSQPYFQGSTVSIQAGTATTIQNAPEVPSQNIAINTPNQVLGGFDANFAGEPVTVQGMTFNLSVTGTSTATDQIRSVSIVNSNGAVVSGPVDAVGSVLNFTNSITFPVGQNTYTLQGTVPSDYLNGGTVQASTNPSSWTGVQGQSSGNTIVISTGNFTMNTMTIRGATLSLSMSATPSSQTIVAGAQNLTMANVQLDASQSGEDIRLSNLPLIATMAGAGTPGSFLSNCELWNGSTLVTSGSNVQNTIGASPATVTFVFDNPLVVPKGTVTTLTLSCNVSSSATNQTYTWSLPVVSTWASTSPFNGVQSGNTLTSTAGLTSNTTPAGTMSVTSGASMAVTLDASSPSYALVSGGTTGVTLAVIKFHPSNEGVNLTKVGLTLNNGTYSGASGAQDIVKAYLYNGSTLLGQAIFAGNATTATSTLTSSLNLPVNTDTLITVKADISDIGYGQPGTEGDLVKIDAANFEGSGVSSGQTIRGVGNASPSSGVAMFNTFPTVSQDLLPSTGVADGRLIHFKVTADSHANVGINQLKFNVATSSLTAGSGLTNFALYGFTDSGYSSPISGQSTGGQIDSTLSTTSGTGCVSTNVTANGSMCTLSSGTAVLLFRTATTTPIEVPAGQTYYFELRSSVAGVQTGSSVVTSLLGDGTQLTGTIPSMKTAVPATGNFVWSPNATTTSVGTVIDWTNGYGVVGLPSSGVIQTRSN